MTFSTYIPRSIRDTISPRHKLLLATRALAASRTTSNGARATRVPDRRVHGRRQLEVDVGQRRGKADLASRRYFDPRPAPQANPPQWTKEELLALVDHYDDTTVDDHLELTRDPFLRRYAPPDGPVLAVSERRDDFDYPSALEGLESSGAEDETVAQLRSALLVAKRDPTKSDADAIYQIYLRLPQPRMIRFPAALRHWLFHVMSRGRKDSKSMLRYFSLMGDVQQSGLSLSRFEWNTAMSFASRYVGKSTESEAEAALLLWREMEREAGIKANEVTFNILFDVASKSGNFTLAEMLYQEMEQRGFTYNRYHHVSLIHFFGLKQNSSGIRAAYREMVEAGEIIDNVVLNCVISGLLRCGEESSAERLYGKMKASPMRISPMPESNYFANKVVTKVLMMFAKVGKRHPKMVSTFQALARTSPDLQTYRLLVSHHAEKTGDIHKVAQLLNEMNWFAIPVHGAIFLSLFKGFDQHGGYSGSDWTEQRLEGVFQSLIQAIDEGTEGLTLERWLVTKALAAFAKCSTEDRVLYAYAALRARWALKEQDEEYVSRFLYKLIGKEYAHKSVDSNFAR